MSRQSGSVFESRPPRGNATDIGFVSKNGRCPPKGAEMLSECVNAMPISPARAARLYRPTAPQCDESLTPTAPMPLVRAICIAASFARSATKMPSPWSPATCAAHGPVGVTTMFGRARIEPCSMRFRSCGRRAMPCESTPHRLVCTRLAATRRALVSSTPAARRQAVPQAVSASAAQGWLWG